MKRLLELLRDALTEYHCSRSTAIREEFRRAAEEQQSEIVVEVKVKEETA